MDERTLSPHDLDRIAEILHGRLANSKTAHKPLGVAKLKHHLREAVCEYLTTEGTSG